MFEIIVLYGRYVLAIAIISFMLFSCRSVAAIQSELTKVKLDRIEIKYKYPNYVAWLIWTDRRNEFSTEIPIDDTGYYRKGMCVYAVMRR